MGASIDCPSTLSGSAWRFFETCLGRVYFLYCFYEFLVAIKNANMFTDSDDDEESLTKPFQFDIIWKMVHLYLMLAGITCRWYLALEFFVNRFGSDFSPNRFDGMKFTSMPRDLFVIGITFLGKAPSVGEKIYMLKLFMRFAAVLMSLNHILLRGRNETKTITRRRLHQSREGKNEDHNLLCIICLQRKKCILFLPCRHLCLCKLCSIKLGNIENTLCPMCRTPIKLKIDAFL